MTASGCGVTVKDYGHLLAHDPGYRGKAERISELTRDLCEVCRPEAICAAGQERAAASPSIRRARCSTGSSSAARSRRCSRASATSSRRCAMRTLLRLGGHLLAAAARDRRRAARAASSPRWKRARRRRSRRRNRLPRCICRRRPRRRCATGSSWWTPRWRRIPAWAEVAMTVRSSASPARTIVPTPARCSYGGGRRRDEIRGDPSMPFTDGTLCTKVAHYLERTYAPDRLLYPHEAGRRRRAKATSGASRGTRRSTRSRRA